jgi:hypothetical protein
VNACERSESIFHRDADGDAEQALADWRDVKDMKLLNLCYDLTPAESITLVITVSAPLPLSRALSCACLLADSSPFPLGTDHDLLQH